MARKKCPACGKKIAEEATYCIYCRTWLGKDKEKTLRDAVVEETIATLMEDGYDSALQILQEEEAPAQIDDGNDEFATRQVDVSLADTATAETAAEQHTMVVDMSKEDKKSAPSETNPQKQQTESKKSRGKLWLTVSIVAFLMIGFVFVSLVIRAARQAQEEPIATTPTVTTTTRNAQHDAWLQTFVGEWVDENSAGKKDMQQQGGHGLYIHEIVGDTVIFDVYSYSAASSTETAYVMNVHAQLDDDDVLHFTFDNDALGHSGEGFMRLCEEGIEMEILIDNAQALAEDENSLAVNAVFVRKSLPQSNGVDLLSLKTLQDVKAVAGEPTAEVTVDKNKKLSTYTFGALTVCVRADNTVYSLSLDYSKLEDKTAYCYDCIDGTMDYDTVKMYFGEAEQDYTEQPTDIRVLHYVLDTASSVTFTFDSESQLLLHIKYDA